MPSTEELDQWLTEISPVINAGQLRRLGETTWWFDLDEYTDLELKLEEDGRRLVFTTDVGTPIAGEELRTYETLLILNGLRSETGGLRMALDGPGGTVDLIFELPLEGVEQLDLQHRMQNFMEAANQWRAVIGTKGGDSNGDGSIEAANMMRV